MADWTILAGFLLLIHGGLPFTEPARSVSQQLVETKSPQSGAAADAAGRYQQAAAFIERGDYQSGRRRLDEAIQLWQRARLTEPAAQALIEMGRRFTRANQWQGAIQCYLQLLRLQKVPPHNTLTAHHSIADLYAWLGQLDLAEAHYQRMVRLAWKTKDRLGRAVALTGLARIQVERGQTEQARRSLEQARQWAQRANDRKAEASVLRLIGRISYDRGQSNEAALTFKKALALDEQAENQAGQAQSLCLLSQLSLAIGQNQAALEYADRALKLVTSLKVSEFQWRAWVALARAQRALGRSEEAYKSFCWALSFIEKNRLVSLSADAFRISFLTERQAVYRELVDLLVERGQAEGAFNAAEFARSRATVDLLAQLGGGEEQQPTPEQAKRLEEGAQRVERLRAQWRSPGLSSQQREALQAALPEAEQRLEEARMEADMNRQMRFTRPTLLRQVQEAVLRPDEALIEFLLGEKHSYVWVISREQANYAALPGRKEIEESVRRYLDVVATRPNALHINRALAKQAESADRLFQLLLGPVAEHLTPDQRLIIVPDGLLHYLPFETLIREGRFLIEQYEISYTPSASVLGLLSARVDRSGQRELLAVGDPVYGPRVPSLPNSRREVQAISEFFPPDARQLYLGPDATEAAMKREPLDRYRIFHLAVHSLIDERFPARSGVMLSVADDPADDGFLDVSEITKLKLDCDLVVLSACQTGRGRLVTGEGIIGFTRAFLYAGARRVAVSLWGVSDLSTAQFMKCFYKHLATRSSPAAALRQAKLDWLSSNNAMRHPFYWAPFVLIGK